MKNLIEKLIVVTVLVLAPASARAQCVVASACCSDPYCGMVRAGPPMDMRPVVRPVYLVPTRRMIRRVRGIRRGRGIRWIGRSGTRIRRVRSSFVRFNF